MKINAKQEEILRRAVAAGRIGWDDLPGRGFHSVRALKRRGLLVYTYDREPATDSKTGESWMRPVSDSFRWEPTEAGRAWVAEHPAVPA